MNQKIKEITLIGMLIALGVVSTSLLRIPLFANIKLDLSYIVLTIAIIKCKPIAAMFVGGVTALIESLLFSINGMSISWAIANVVIALVASYFYKLSKTKNQKYLFLFGIILGCFVGVFLVKSFLETILFNIPIVVRFPKNLVAFISDTFCMIIGYFAALKLNL